MTIKEGYGVAELKDEDGNLTAYDLRILIYRHLVGILHRTIQLLENGVKPVWVFDGKPPELKSKELEKRKELKMKAEEEKKEALKEVDLVTAKKMVCLFF
jgi:flap endonuclease-1